MGRAKIGDSVVIAVAVDHGVVARGDPAIVLGQVELGIMILARVAPADPQRHTVDLLLPRAARRGDQQPGHRRRADWRTTAGAEARASLVDSPAAVAGHPIGDGRRRDRRRDVWYDLWRWPSYGCGALRLELCHRHSWRGGRD